MAQNFQNSNKDLNIIKSVRLYKSLKNDLFNWGQVLIMICNFIIGFACIVGLFELYSMLMGCQPFVINIASVTRTLKLFAPSDVSNTMMGVYLV